MPTTVHDDAQDTLDNVVGIQGVQTGGSGINAGLTGPGFWAQASLGAAITVHNFGTRYLPFYKTAGAGTAASPWTGWETAFTTLSTTGTGTISVSQGLGVARTVTGVGTLFLSELTVGQYLHSGVSFGRVSAIATNLSCTVEHWYGAGVSAVAYKIYTPSAIYAPAGYYSTASSIVIAYPHLTLRGDGSHATHFKFTGSGVGFDGRVGTAYHIGGASLEGFSVQGNANITELIYTQGMTRYAWRDIQGWDCSANGFRVYFALGCHYDNVRVTYNDITSGTKPAVAFYVELAYECEWTNLLLENNTTGTGLKFFGHWSRIKGTSEGNLVNVDYLGGDHNKFDGFDMEGGSATTHSLKFTGGDHNKFVNCTGNKTVQIYQSGANNPWNNRFEGGKYDIITVGAQCTDTVFQDLKYNDNAGGDIADSGRNTQYRNISDSQTRIRKAYDIVGGLRLQKQFETGPTVAATGIGSGTVSLEVGSNNTVLKIAMAAAGAPSASGTVTITCGPAWVGENPAVLCNIVEHGSVVWDAAARVYPSNVNSKTSIVLSWSNNGVALSAGTTYRIHAWIVGTKQP